MGGTDTVYHSEHGDRRVLMINRDITERTMLDGAPDAIWLLSAGLRFSYVNEAACRLFDHAHEDLTEQPLRRFFTPNKGVKVEEALHAVQWDSISNFMTTVQRPDGNRIIAEVHTVDLGSGMYQCAPRDITAWVYPVQARVAFASAL